MLQKFKKNKKGELLQETVVFVILNVLFFSMMILFLYLRASSNSLVEESTAKQVALIIDGAKSGTTIELNLGNFFNRAEKEGISKSHSIKIDNENKLIIVKLSEEGFYEYSYFNNLSVNYKIQGDYLILEVANA